MKLSIGSGRKSYPGHETIDVETYANPTHLGDFRTMNFSDVEEIRAHHLLEHFSRTEGEEVLKLWHDWLKQGGLLIVETPDFEGICDNFRKDKYWMTRHAYGSQEADWAFHRTGYYEDSFKYIMPKMGFEILSIKKSVSRKILPNITVVAKKL